MNSKRLMVVLGCLLAGAVGVAGADVKLYGQLDVSIDSKDRDGVGDSDDINMNSTNSAVGFKGSEDLGNGMSAFFKVEYQTNLAHSGSNGDGWTGRDQYIGMGTRFGKLTLGTMSTAYKSGSKALDPMYRTRIQARDVGIQSILHRGKGEVGQGRATNTIRYDSPAFAGITGTAYYTLDSDADPDNDDDPWGAGLHYKQGNIYAFADYITNGQGGDSDAWQFGGKYTLGSAAFWGMYELDGGLISTQTWASDGNGDGADVWSLGASYDIFSTLIAFRYGAGLDGDGQSVKTEYNTWSLSGQYSMSNRTMLYAGFSEQDCNKGNQGSAVVNDLVFCQTSGEDDIFTLGMRHNF